MADNITTSEHQHISNKALLATVFITGACVLIIELMGTRILAPYFGSGIYTWSALIAITLAALALGYTFGGRLADRLPRANILYNLCLLAGLWTLSTPMLASPLLPAMIQIPDIRLGVLLSGCILYFPNLFLLGAICPFVIRLMTRQRETVGAVSGQVFAVSTIGSLLGALGTGFFLIPNFGVQAAFTFCGFTLLVLAMLGNFRVKFISYALVLIALVVSLLLFTSKKPDVNSSIEILDETSGFYGQLQVIRKSNQKSLLVDGIGQNYVFEGGTYISEYINFISALPGLRQDIRHQHKALVIGLGAGQLPTLFQQDDFDVVTVEIDPNVGAMAVRHFGFNLPAEQVHYMDGRLFLLKDTNTYDYLIIDAFSAEQIAWHLISAEALIEARSRLNASGLLVINVTSVTNGEDIAALQKTLRAVYPEVRAFSQHKEEGKLTSIIFLASMSPVHLTAEGALLSDQQHQDTKLFLSNELGRLKSDIILTDDFNPVSHQRKHIQLLWREAMIEYLGEDNLNWLLL